MRRRYDWITFDCYGTLVDWENGIGTAFIEAAAADGVELRREAVLTAYHAAEPRVQAGPYRSYREVLAETAILVARRLGWSLEPAGAGFLADSLARWEPFDDTNPGLRRLRSAGYRLGILSNVDDDLLAGTLARLSVRFDLLLTAQTVRSYKPATPHFLAARERLGEARWLHAAQSYSHDVVPARSLGIPVAWINRKAETSPDGGRPDQEVRSLGDLADRLCGPVSR